MAFRAATVVKALRDPRLKLVAGKGYWYFIFDDVKANRYETHSVLVMRLNQLPLKQWIEEGREFLNKVTSKGVSK
jgi:hypothetical protein